MTKRQVIKVARARFLFGGGCRDEWSYFREELLSARTWREAACMAAGWDRQYRWRWLRRWADKQAIRRTLQATA